MRTDFPYNDFSAIVVMGAAIWAKGTLSGVACRRTHQAAELFNSVNPGYLVFSGGLGKHPPAEAIAMAAEAVRLGIPESRILCEDQSTNTFQSIARVSMILVSHGIKRCIVVSDSYHLARCCAMFRDRGFDVRGFAVRGTREVTPSLLWMWLHIREFIALAKYYLFERQFGDWLARKRAEM